MIIYIIQTPLNRLRTLLRHRQATLVNTVQVTGVRHLMRVCRRVMCRFEIISLIYVAKYRYRRLRMLLYLHHTKLVKSGALEVKHFSTYITIYTIILTCHIIDS